MELYVRAHCVYVLPHPIVTLMQIAAAELPYQRVLQQEVRVTPAVPVEQLIDLYGNRLQRAALPEGRVEIEYEAHVDVSKPDAPATDSGEAALDALPPDVVLMTLPSRYCPSDQLARLAATLFNEAPHGYSRVAAICDWIGKHVTYEYGHSTTATSALETITSGVGVCRDFAHLAIAFCRALNIPARYASGYCLDLDPPDFHGYFQAYLATPDGTGAWYTFDATVPKARAALVAIAFGRDAADISMLTFYGTAEFVEQQISVTRRTDAREP